MEKTPHRARRSPSRLLAAVAALAGPALLGIVAVAQDFPMAGGNPNRTGLPTDVVGGRPATQYNQPGRAFLRWWDPIRAIRSTIDNDTPGASVVAGTWESAADARTIAFGYVQIQVGTPPYRYATTVRSTSRTDPTAGSTARYQWLFTNLEPNTDYELYVNLPVGPTVVGDLSRFPQRYWVFEVTQVEGGSVTDVVDFNRGAGGYVRLGNGGLPTERTFRPSSNVIAVTLHNTAPLDPDGQLRDPLARPGEELVYADAAEAVSLSKRAPSTVVATPVVSQIGATRPGGVPETFRWRVVGASNESFFLGDLSRQYQLGVVTSYVHNGALAQPGNVFRRNLVWSFPVKRPFDNSEQELTRYALERRDWITGVDLGPGLSRADQVVQVDDLNGSVSATAGFTPANDRSNAIGPTYRRADVRVGSVTEQVVYEPSLPAGNYFVELHVPGDSSLPRRLQVHVLQGAVIEGVYTFDSSRPRGWYRLPFQPRDGTTNDPLVAPLRVAITNSSTDPADAGKVVVADAVRFVRQADLSVDSTPVQVDARIRAGAGLVDRSVVVVAMENGRITCMDAHGDPAAGGRPTVYWTYPSERPATDPNRDPSQDGKDGIAEAPTGFDLSSAMVQRVDGEDFLYIASQNGKVYCLEMAGRGDGTTVRRWTYPDDYDPSQPELPMQRGLRPIVGSVAFGTAAGGRPIVIVPLAEGRVVALDALGDAATRRTSVVWQWPPATEPVLGPVETTPVVAFGRVFFAAAQDQTSAVGEVFALNEADGSLAWRQADTAQGGFAPFGTAGGVAVPSEQIVASAGNFPGGRYNVDSVFFCDQGGKLVSLDPATGGVRWRVVGELPGAGASLRFTYLRLRDSVGAGPFSDVPVVLVPGLNGRVSAVEAGGATGRNGNHTLWRVNLSGSDQRASIATGGFDPGVDPRHSWMYTGCSEGFLYAFNSVSDTNPDPLTPGEPPIDQPVDQGEDEVDRINSILDRDNIVLVSPEGFDRLRERADTGSITAADVAGARLEEVSRRHMEFGETFYVLVTDLPILSGSLANYYLEFEVTSTGRATQRRQIPVRPLTDNPNVGFCLTGIPLMTTGSAGVIPGAGFVRVSAVAPGQRGLRSEQVRIKQPSTFVPNPDCDFYAANPLAVTILDNAGAVSLSVGDGAILPVNAGEDTPEFKRFFVNGSEVVDQFATHPTLAEPFGFVGPDLRSKGEFVAHGGVGRQNVVVTDRSLTFLLLGRALTQVRVGPRDVAWRPDGSPTGGVKKPLPDRFPGFEDYPVFIPNRSLDYPDVGRENLQMTSNFAGLAQNPLFGTGVELNSPRITDPNAVVVYRTRAGFDAQLNRALVPTVFDTYLNVPRFQPPSPPEGYYGSQTVFIESQVGGAQQGSLRSQVFRRFGLGLNVGVDERITMQTPTIDLGSIPGGGGFNGGPDSGPRAPWDPNSLFTPWDPTSGTNPFGSLFQPFAFTNEGNVNLTNLRVAKFFSDSQGARPVEIFAPGLHELAWLDAQSHLHTSLDRRFAASRRVSPGSPGHDEFGRNVLQKPRPGDVVGTRFNVNPLARTNANLRTLGGFLFDQTVVRPGDPRVGVTAPIGAPSGAYQRRVYVFEDSGAPTLIGAEEPTLDLDESFTQPGATLKVTVRETRVTNAASAKAAPIADRLLAGDEPYAWGNVQPTGMRDGLGNLFVAWSSNRLESGTEPGWLARPRVDADLANQDRWRVYVGSIRGDIGAQNQRRSESPVRDLNTWVAENDRRWMRHGAAVPPLDSGWNPNSLFTLAPGESIVPGSDRYGAPAFPTAGFFDLLEAPFDVGRSWNNATPRYLAFLGEAERRDAAGNLTRVSQVMVAPMRFAADGAVTYAASELSASPLDVTGRKSRPSLVQVGNNATVFVTSTSGALGQLFYTSYNPGRPAGERWVSGNLRLGRAFESLGGPSVTLRRYRNADNDARLEITFPARVTGRRFSEVYMARLPADAATGLPRGRANILFYPLRREELTVDPATSVFWAPGLRWRTTDEALANLDVLTFNRSGVLETVKKPGAQVRFDAETGIARFESRLGGDVVFDTDNGSVRFTGAILRRGARLYIDYEPSILRVSTGAGANHRSVASLFDDRFIGIRWFPNNPQRNLLGDLSYWSTELGQRPTFDSPLRWDRFLVSYTRSSGEGAATTRPFYKTLRFGVQLPYPVAVRADGTVTSFQVTFSGGSERVYQIDPAAGRVYFSSNQEEREVTVRYAAADETGNPIGEVTWNDRVRLVTEFDEQAIPIEQAGNETALSMALDPLNGAFNNSTASGRRPGLVWLFWSSARLGTPDVYTQTIAPRFSARPPVP